MESIFKKRILAYIIDYFVITALMWILAQILAIIIIPYSMFIIYNYFVFILPIITIIYFAFLEKNKGVTVGKSIMFLKVVSSSGNEINYFQAIIRNLSKIYWVPIIVDLIIGRFYGDESNERILGKLSKTKVVNE